MSYQAGDQVKVYPTAYVAATAPATPEARVATVVREMPNGVAEYGQAEYELAYDDGKPGATIVAADRLRLA